MIFCKYPVMHVVIEILTFLLFGTGQNDLQLYFPQCNWKLLILQSDHLLWFLPLGYQQDTDFWGPVYMTYFALPHLRRTYGKILVTASVGSYIAFPRESIYNVSKSGLLH